MVIKAYLGKIGIGYDEEFKKTEIEKKVCYGK